MPSLSRFSRLRAAARMPKAILTFKVAQMARLEAMRILGSWPRLQQRTFAYWSPPQVKAWLEQAGPSLVAGDGYTATRGSCEKGMLERSRLVGSGEEILGRRFSVLGAAVPIQASFPWHSDWRHGHRWEKRYFKTYDLYAPVRRSTPFDVKYPWELSRLAFLPRLLQAEVLSDGALASDRFILQTLDDWIEQNPVAYSVNWYPMEASMRSVNLCLLLGMFRRATRNRTDEMTRTLQLATLHGEFIWQTREFTEVRGNHYAANLTALILISLELGSHYPNAKRWLDFTATAIPNEIVTQFLPDGVHFEKSLPYHRLVTELFLLARIALQRAGRPLPDEAELRLRRAAEYCSVATRPDQRLPQIGDSDDASAFPLDNRPPSDPAPLLALASVLWKDAALRNSKGELSPSVPWLLGTGGVAGWESVEQHASRAARRYFEAGGIVLVKEMNSYLLVDVGEVGLQGRGGHGHNDLFSFELWIDGLAVVVDPGTYMYTGNMERRNLFRSSSYHNGLTIDGQEIAPLRSMWRIEDVARPLHLEVGFSNPCVTVSGLHRGYGRLPNPAEHQRRLEFLPGERLLRCDDTVRSEGSHDVIRSLHLSPATDVRSDRGGLTLSQDSSRFLVRFDTDTQARIEPGWISPGYGQLEQAPIIRLSSRTQATTSLFFTIEGLS